MAENYEPKVTVIIPTYNEADAIMSKIENLEKIDYPMEKFKVIFIDSASTDGTPEIIRSYLKSHVLPFKTIFLEETQRTGKAKALNFALDYVSDDLVATSDADCLWTPDSLRNAVKYLSDPSVAAVCGQETLMDQGKSSVIRTERYYRSLLNYIRIGESKIHSTVAFEGGLAIYKRDLLEKFNESCDDSHSAFDLVQKGFRTLLVPDAFFLNQFPPYWDRKISKKTRRAQHVIEVWLKCFKLDLKRKLSFSPWISRINVFLYVFNPLLFPVFIVTLFLVLIEYPILTLAIPPILLIPKTRDMLMLYATNYLFLLTALFREASGKKQIIWAK